MKFYLLNHVLDAMRVTFVEYRGLITCSAQPGLCQCLFLDGLSLEDYLLSLRY